MLNVNIIKKGIVIDHIKAGSGYKIFKELKLHRAEHSVALLKNVMSDKMNSKDLIKIENEIDLNLDILGIIAPDTTVNIIEEGNIVRKIAVPLPDKVKGTLSCKNPACVSTIENIENVEFTLVDSGNKKYKCEFCDSWTTL